MGILNNIVGRLRGILGKKKSVSETKKTENIFGFADKKAETKISGLKREPLKKRKTTTKKGKTSLIEKIQQPKNKEIETYRRTIKQLGLFFLSLLLFFFSLKALFLNQKFLFLLFYLQIQIYFQFF